MVRFKIEVCINHFSIQRAKHFTTYDTSEKVTRLLRATRVDFFYIHKSFIRTTNPTPNAPVCTPEDYASAAFMIRSLYSISYETEGSRKYISNLASSALTLTLTFSYSYSYLACFSYHAPTFMVTTANCTIANAIQWHRVAMEVNMWGKRYL